VPGVFAAPLSRAAADRAASREQPRAVRKRKAFAQLPAQAEEAAEEAPAPLPAVSASLSLGLADPMHAQTALALSDGDAAAEALRGLSQSGPRSSARSRIKIRHV
jgi:hypothetical protein